MGDDIKTGQTRLKSVMADFLISSKNRKNDNEIFYFNRSLDYDKIKTIKGRRKRFNFKKGEEVDEDNYIFEMKKNY